MAHHRTRAIRTKSPSPPHGKASRELVEEAETLALAEVGEPLHISALCVALVVSERTLRKAFHNAYGLPPCRHLRRLRLSQARQALLCADCTRVTVTEIATGFGFVELGRFSVEYRKMYGETPSQTLHHAFPSRVRNVSPAVQDNLFFGV
jgi:transcriptional regulator GlxA family with amidase domain